MNVNSRVTKVNEAAFQNRFKQINADRDTMTVWECIDRPIRPLIFELARVGMIPKFSCCGYTYESEEEPKTHHGKTAYVHFYAPVGLENNLNDVFMLCKYVGWKYNIFCEWIWNIYTKNPVPDDMYSKSDGIEEAIHQYEGYAMKIERLALEIQNRIPTHKDPVTISDGNQYYSYMKSWTVKPKQDFVIGVDEYYNKYGKFDMEDWYMSPSKRVGVDLVSGEMYQEWVKEMNEKDEKDEVVHREND